MVAHALLVYPNADRADCGNAADRDTAAVSLDALISYARGVAQIEALDNAHDNFTDAISDTKACR